MPLLATAYIDYMAHAIGDAPVDTRHKLIDGFNFAGRRLYLAHHWTWRDGGYASLVGVASQNYIALPSDFSAVISAHVDNSSSNSLNRVRQVTLEEIMAMREAGSPTVAGVWNVSFEGAQPQSAATVVMPARRADIFPTPSTNGTPTISLRYRRTWAEIAVADIATAYPNIPVEAEESLLYLCRAIAKNLENQSEAIENALQNVTIQTLINEDVRRQRRYGRVRGGAMDRFGRVAENPFTSITNNLAVNNP